MDRNALIEKIRLCQTLPTLPTVAIEVLRLTRHEEIDLAEIASLISKDPALSSKVLKTVNSSLYGLHKPVGTISTALVILGVDAVKTLAMGFSLVNSLRGGAQDQIQMAYWRRSLYSAVAARLLSQRLGAAEAEELFLAALLQDVGVQVLKQVLGEDYAKLLTANGVSAGRLLRRERHAFGLDHAAAGGLLAEQWNLPPLLRAAIRWHHQPEQAGSAFARQCHMVRFAGLCAGVFMGGDAARCVKRVHNYARALFVMDRDACDLLLTEIAGGVRELADLFDVNIGRQASYGDILAEASETLAQLTLQSQVQAKAFKAKSETDGLTGLTNRRRLDEILRTEFEQAHKFLHPLSVIFADVDHFKKINDAYGHAAGDEVLRHVARLIALSARPMDTAARYGGEEFVLLLPRMSLINAVQAAEQLRLRVQNTPLQVANEPRPVTISLGVVCLDGLGGPFRSAEQLLQAADKAAYAAKNAGRNTIRVFTPRVKRPAPM